jgi:uncharacterized protein YciI
MWYCIFATDCNDSLSLRQKHRLKHLKRLEELQSQGRLLLAGPFPAIDSTGPGPNGFTGSLIIAEFNCLFDAKEWANQDPFMLNGIYEDINVKPFKKILP